MQMTTNNSPSRRRKGFILPYSTFERMLKAPQSKLDICGGQVPVSAKLLGVYTDYQRDAFVLMFEDESFEETPEGCLTELEYLIIGEKP